ncbi:ankyrin repeat domain-containing protein 39 [Bacillus rossius redtenbacheri]|uniref:ankyrin repeat domain-containing protein 39 n=1 Tax=Bacillus rossius redtenbacheri TaxID=93214 RepID=UPI002FDDB890
MSDCREPGCKCLPSTSSVSQTMDEMDFERGIWYAAQNNDLERVEKLLRKGVCPDAPDAAGYTALHHAARAGHLKVCTRLLNAGASVDAATRAGHATALHRAAAAGRLPVVDLLLLAGANTKLPDVDGKTALHRAAEHGHLPVVKSILQACPDLKYRRDERGKLPLYYARGNDEVARLLG